MTQSTGKLLVDSPRAMCQTCKEVFSTPGNFDKHMTPFGERFALSTENQNRKRNSKVCVDPSTVGLVLSESSGVWITPQDWRA